ncbi:MULTISPECIES: RNA 2'-phosphotransferase [unclassified Agrobacterium]|uniref:RNA 2'-phosphotransferase n=1 Tax=unclassified Agrobacterium TaxID=2632611 RepID=UPI00244966F0|nr:MULTISPECIES: RNA 2'-phosphotransferase [unclassified Agrobacterium]MDH0612219.1 RNA 2'-phosphotransferase [Agrobacterium sp. GD03872]MDH0696116.1 RNA 2'-phosphotransferase [Agrobacterium sp. GD03871]MDH1059018.1 RNA 2'-phosphotransferase [Agrobacterium sp. GD03992]MDH2210380.1 RNA 2'-phosphotransferase [Agrobacterium sp. GD03643]MDH2217883.1 RNA 2'-phosphotransferase [Agrobacterium sp. GD03638]
MSPATSKFLSYVLRHAPESIGLTLDAQGWADVADLLAKANASGMPLDEAGLFSVVAESDKKRFTLSEDGRRIRAAQGHSVKVDLGQPPVEPPPQLFHGTATRFLESIMREGLRPGSRQQVHLSEDRTTAHSVGQRHGKPAVLVVDAGRMFSEGHRFYQADNGVWLTDEVPTAYLVPIENHVAESDGE